MKDGRTSSLTRADISFKLTAFLAKDERQFPEGRIGIITNR